MAGFNAIIYGESGAGKTPLCATLENSPLTSPVLFLDVDRGTMSIRGDKIPTIVRVDQWPKIQGIYTYLKQRNNTALAKYLSELNGEDVSEKEYKSVVIDSGTELEYICRAMIMAETVGQEVPQQQDYLKTQERMRKLFRYFRDLPDMTFVVTAGVRELKDDALGMVRHFPAFQPSLSKDLVRMTDETFFMNVAVEKEKLVRTLQTSLSVRVVARDRSQLLEPLLRGETLDLSKIAEVVLRSK